MPASGSQAGKGANAYLPEFSDSPAREVAKPCHVYHVCFPPSVKVPYLPWEKLRVVRSSMAFRVSVFRIQSQEFTDAHEEKFKGAQQKSFHGLREWWFHPISSHRNRVFSTVPVSVECPSSNFLIHYFSKISFQLLVCQACIRGLLEPIFLFYLGSYFIL